MIFSDYRLRNNANSFPPKFNQACEWVYLYFRDSQSFARRGIRISESVSFNTQFHINGV